MKEPSSKSPARPCEVRQKRWIGPYAVGEDESSARAVAEQPHPYRTCFQRDRDRIVHCSAFRRLDFKTQVFVPHEHDHFRTRLTHTLEVAQIARTLGRALRLNEDLIETVALAHDLGHPPFGHGGEGVLDELMTEHGRFEHNRQTLRVVDYLEHPYPRFRGLNLTTVVRECLARHKTRYDAPSCEEFDTNLQAPLEGQLVDLADEIAYTSADLEDALAAGWIDAEQLRGLALWRDAWKAADVEAPDARAIHKRIRACKGVLASMADDLLAATTTNIAELGLDSVGAVRHASQPAVAFFETMRNPVARLQEFLFDAVYMHPANVEQDDRAGRIIRGLFAAYVADPGLLPPRYRQRIDADGLHRVVCDYIAGMTDRFCQEEHAKICTRK